MVIVKQRAVFYKEFCIQQVRQTIDSGNGRFFILKRREFLQKQKERENEDDERKGK